MKYIFFLMCFTNAVVAQKLTPESLKKTTLEQHKKIVSQALTYNDIPTAINSIHQIIALEEGTSTYKDSLAIAYFSAGNYVSCHLVTKELLKNQPHNEQLLEINAISLQSLRATKEAIEAYEVLFAKTNNMAHGYELGNLQYSIKRLDEAKATLSKAATCPEIEKATVTFPIDKTKNQQVPLLAAVNNLKGVVSFELKENTEAQEAFEAALKIMPEFAVATQNANAVLISIQNEKNSKNKTTAPQR